MSSPPSSPIHIHCRSAGNLVSFNLTLCPEPLSWIIELVLPPSSWKHIYLCIKTNSQSVRRDHRQSKLRFVYFSKRNYCDKFVWKSREFVKNKFSLVVCVPKYQMLTFPKTTVERWTTRSSSTSSIKYWTTCPTSQHNRSINRNQVSKRELFCVLCGFVSVKRKGVKGEIKLRLWSKLVWTGFGDLCRVESHFDANCVRNAKRNSKGIRCAKSWHVGD